jgi:uncharacterized membrane protein
MFYQPPADGVVPGGALTDQGYIARIGSATGQVPSTGWPAEVTSADVASGLASSLAGNLAPVACMFSCAVQVGIPPLASATLNTVLKPLLQGLDPLLDGVLKALGVKLGRAEVAVTGVRCGVPVLVS